MQVFNSFQEVYNAHSNVVSGSLMSVFNAEFMPIRELTLEEQKKRIQLEQQFNYYEQELSERIYAYMGQRDEMDLHVAQAYSEYMNALGDRNALNHEIEQFKNGGETYPLRSAKTDLERIGVEVNYEFSGFFEGTEL